MVSSISSLPQLFRKIRNNAIATKISAVDSSLKFSCNAQKWWVGTYLLVSTSTNDSLMVCMHVTSTLNTWINWKSSVNTPSNTSNRCMIWRKFCIMWRFVQGSFYIRQSRTSAHQRLYELITIDISFSYACPDLAREFLKWLNKAAVCEFGVSFEFSRVLC